MGRKRSIGRSKKGWTRSEKVAEEVAETIESGRQEEKIQTVNNDDLFFVDTTGTFNSHSNKKKRKKIAAAADTNNGSDASAAAAAAADAAAVAMVGGGEGISGKKQDGAAGGDDNEDAATHSTPDITEELATLLTAECDSDDDNDKQEEPVAKKAEKRPATTIIGRKSKKPRRSRKKTKTIAKEQNGVVTVQNNALALVPPDPAKKEQLSMPDDDALFDVWETEDPELKMRRESIVQGFETDITPHQNRKKFRKKQHIQASKAHLKHPTLSVSHAGTSVNPLPQHHQQIIQKALDALQAEKDENERISKRLNPTLSAEVNRAPPERDDGSELFAPKKAPARMTKAEKNKKKKASRKKQLLDELRKQKKVETQLGRADVVLKEIEKSEKERKKEKERIAMLKETQNDKRPKLGKHKFEPAMPIDVRLQEELTGSLRTMKPSIHTMRDQFQRFQDKNLITTTHKQKSRATGNYKYYTKSTFKVTDADEQAEISRDNSSNKHSKYSSKRLSKKKI